MEKKQLNLNAPFYSVRRYSSPSHSSELSKPKTIKDKTLLPPSRQQSLPLIKSEYENDELTKPTSFVPFHWEQSPGRPKCEIGLSNSVRFHSGEIPKLPPGRLLSGPLKFTSTDQNLLYKPQVEAFSFSDHASLLEKLNEGLKCGDDESGSESEEEEEEEEEKDAYSDALDSLSLSELRSLNYSTGAKPSGTFSVDAQTRDLMMNRFLPAAKAAVLETQTPQYTPKKSSTVVPELPKQVIKNVVSGGVRRPVVKKYGGEATLPYHNSDYIDNYYLESEDLYKESRIPIKKSGKRWGIMIPRFCVKNSLCLLNPLPALKPKPRPQTPSFNEMRRLTRKALSGPLDKIACPTPHKKKFHSGLLSRELQSIEHKPYKDSNIFPNSRDSYSLSTSPLRRYRSGNLSPYRNEIPTKSPPREGQGFSSVTKKVDNSCKNDDGTLASSRKLFKALQDVSRNQKNGNRSSPGPLLGSNNNLKTNKGLDSEPWPFENNEDEEYEVKRVIKEEHKVVSNQSTEFAFVLNSPLPPPLPKSPSESWLWRTLPLGNPFTHSNRVSAKKQAQTINADADSKWESIVKSTNLHRDSIRYSQELTPRPSGKNKAYSRGSIVNN